MNKDLSLAELEEYLETSGPVHPDDTTGVEIASRGRKVRQLGILSPSGDGSQASLFMPDVALSGLRFSEEAAGFTYWLMNIGKSMTTGASWRVLTQHFVRWNRSG